MTVSPPPRHAEPHASAAVAFDHSGFDRLLSENVSGGRIDYRHIRAARRRDLDRYLDRLAMFDPDRLPRDEHLAFEINLYNASMIRAVIDRLGSAWSPSDSGFAVFLEPLVRTVHGAISLDSLEHGIIRPGFQEPRVHVALVCGAVSCPPILPRAWRGRDLDLTLDRSMAAFARDSSRNRVDEASHALHLSPIFQWYAMDFVPLGGPVAILSRALGRDLRGWRVYWLEYDWSLNSAP